MNAGEVVVYNMAMSPAKKGDLNGDKEISIADAIMALQIISGITPSVPIHGADVNGDGKIGLSETIYILQKVGGTR